MEKIKLIEAKELVNNNISSLFTKQDVLDLLEKIDNSSNMDIVKEILNKAKEEFVNGLQNVKYQIVDLDSAELEISMDNRVVVNDIDIDYDVIEGVLEELIDVIKEDFEEQK